MKKNLFFIAIAMYSMVASAQTQSIVLQKNTLPNANQNFNFSTAGPAGSAFAANPVITLHDEFSAKQPLEIGASAAGFGYLAFTQKDAPVNDVYTYSSGDPAWIHPAGNNAVRLDIETSGINWQINAANNIYRNGVASGTAKDVGVGADNGVYIIGTDDKIYKWVSGSSYTALAGSPQPTGKRVDGGPVGTAWYVGLNNHVYEYTGTTSINHGLPGGQAAKDIAVGSNGTAWTIAPNPSNVNYDILYYWNGSAWVADALAPTGTTMYNVTVGADNEPLMTLSFNGGRSYLLKRLSDGRWVEIVAQTAGINNTIIYYNQPSGNYSFTETVAAGYYLQDVLIFGTNGDSYNTNTGTSTISLGSGEHAYIQYTNVLGSKPAAQIISTACGGTFVETFGTVVPNTVSSLPVGQTTYTFNTNPMGHYQGNGTNDGQYDVVSSVFDATGYYYQWVSGPGVDGAACSYNCDIHAGGSRDVSDHDHTGNTNGGMLLVNADFSSGVYYEKEYAGLVPGNSYQFSAWLANVLLAVATDATDPNVILRVIDPTTGQILLDLPSGDIPKTGTTLTWIEKKGSFIAPASGNVKVYLINNKPGGQGNDLVLDDISLTATCQTISGTIFNDANGMTDGLVNGVGTNTSSSLYAVLVDASNNIVASSLLPANGTYSFSNLFSGTYSIKITTTAPGTIGAPAPNASLTDGWLNTGDSVGTNNGTGGGFITSGNLDSINVVVGTVSVTGVDFGIERAPMANDVSSLVQLNPNGTVQFIVPTLKGSDPEQGTFGGVSGSDTVVIKTLPTNATLYYDFGAGPVAIILGVNDTIKNYDPAKLTIDPIDGPVTVTFDYVELDAALVSSNIATVTMPFSVPLPITLNNFSAKLNKNKIDLIWNIASEISADNYIVERSNDNIEFISLGKIIAKSSAGIAVDYQYTDAAPVEGVNFYRLKITDKNGSVSFSKVIAVRNVDDHILMTTVSPNPFMSAIKINIDLKRSTTVNVALVDAVGKTIAQKIFKGTSGLNKFNIADLNKLMPGVYIIRISSDNIITQQKLIKL
ncbi:T9SS type A sorting domain-containing protein [Ferruginibacter sp. SUN002]|uniref:T9SS type A sorting domain-containing protein n=1 Tax=Ferruginibacter sp. SUN002 TaxID=2937789 RepID=UPI003D3602C9